MDFSDSATQGISVLLLIGFLMIAAEVFVPGMILGMLGALCLLAAVSWTYAAYGLGAGTMVLAGVSIVGTLAFVGYMAAFPKTFIGRQIINSDAQSSPANTPELALLGKTGESLTMLRPSGTARIEGRRLDVLAEGAFIEPHSQIIVVRVEGNHLVVRKA
jgi:membrane-bound serine protease (ClpP class)